jgi:hypothetical protein
MVRPTFDFGVLLGETEYLWLVDWSGRQLHEDKPGVIDPRLPFVLNTLQPNYERVTDFITDFTSPERVSQSETGSPASER